MSCKVGGCNRKVMYKAQGVCQMHYFRMMRNGTYDRVMKRKYRIQNPAGYQKVYEPRHPMANADGYTYEHRKVYFDQINKNPDKCEICSSSISWKNLHIDHKDNDVTNNVASNLRALCRSCNVFRGHTAVSMGKMFIEIDGKVLTPTAWSRQPGVKVSHVTIRRRKQAGMSDYDCVYGEKVTHKSTEAKKHTARYDYVRGIS